MFKLAENIHGQSARGKRTYGDMGMSNVGDYENGGFTKDV